VFADLSQGPRGYDTKEANVHVCLPGDGESGALESEVAPSCLGFDSGEEASRVVEEERERVLVRGAFLRVVRDVAGRNERVNAD